MATLCLDCGSFSRYEIYSGSSSSFVFNQNGEETLEDNNDNDETTCECGCGSCREDNLLWFEGKELTKKQLLQLFDVEEEEDDISEKFYHKRLKLMLLFAIENDKLCDTEELIKKCKEEKVLNSELKKKLVVKAI